MRKALRFSSDGGRGGGWGPPKRHSEHRRQLCIRRQLCTRRQLCIRVPGAQLHPRRALHHPRAPSMGRLGSSHVARRVGAVSRLYLLATIVHSRPRFTADHGSQPQLQHAAIPAHRASIARRLPPASHLPPPISRLSSHTSCLSRLASRCPVQHAPHHLPHPSQAFLLLAISFHRRSMLLPAAPTHSSIAAVGCAITFSRLARLARCG